MSENYSLGRMTYPPKFTKCCYDEVGKYERICHDCGRTFDISTPAGAGEVFFGHLPCDERWENNQ